MTGPPPPGVEMPGASQGPLRGLAFDGYASPALSDVSPLGVAAARRERRQSRRPVRRVMGGAQVAGAGVLAAGVLAVSATRIGALDTSVPALSFEPAVDADWAPGPTIPHESASTVPVIDHPAPPTVEPTLEFAGQRWQLVWALVPSNPAESAGLWPGTPWPGNPGRSLIGVQADLSRVAPGDGFAIDGRAWTVFSVEQVAPEDWERLAEQPVEASEVAVYELQDTPGRGRVAALARGGR